MSEDRAITTNPWKGFMLIEQTYDKLSAMKLYGMSNSVKERLGRPDHRDLGFTELFGLVVDDEWTYRTNRRLKGRLRNAKFKEQASLENLDYATARGLKKSIIMELAQNHWVKAAQQILITGPSGSGKSYLAQAFGNHLCRSDYSVIYQRMSKLLLEITQAKATGTFFSLLKKLARTDVLIIDDWGLAPLSEEQRTDLLDLLEERYGLHSTILTSQLPVNEWHPYLQGGRVADAICDRLIHQSHRIELRAVESMRKEKTNLTKGEKAEKI